MSKHLTYSPNLPFRSCGFEFTAEKKAGFKYPTVIEKEKTWINYGRVSYGSGYSRFGYYPGGYEDVDTKIDLNKKNAAEIFETTKNKIDHPSWIKKNAHDDDCLECPTPIVKDRYSVVSYFKEFKASVEKINLTIDTAAASGELGGCHIHISTNGLKEVKSAFFINILNFVTSYPELNWGFNDPNDTENANNMLLLSRDTRMSSLMSRLRSSRNIRVIQRLASRETRMGRIGIASKMVQRFHEIVVEEIVARGSRTVPQDSVIKFNRYELALAAPAATSKCCAINYRGEKRTIEFRFFNQPINLSQHILHTEVAQRIFEHCYQMAKQKKTIDLAINKGYFKKVTEEQAVNRFKYCMLTLGINPARCTAQIANIRTRFKWHKEDKRAGYLK